MLLRRLALAVAAAALAIWVLGFASRGLFSGDSGVKLAQSHALWDGGFSTRALPQDRAVDPSGKFLPYEETLRRPVFQRVVDGEHQGIYSLSFTAAAAPLVGLLGTTGMMLVGLAGGIGILLGVDRLLGRMGASSPARVAGAVIAVALTPVLLYSAQFTEHTPAVALCTFAIAALLEPRRPLIAGLLLGLAATMRGECYIAIAAAGVALVARDTPGRVRDGVRFVAGALAPLLLYWALNLWLSGTWDPVVTSQKAAPERWLNTERLLFGEPRDGSPVLWLGLLGFVTMLALAPPPRAAADPRGPILRLLGSAILLFLAWTLHAQFERALAAKITRVPRGLFAVTPLVAYGLLGSIWEARWRPVWIYGALATAAIVALNGSNDAGGLQLGARFLLPVVPALIALAVATVDAELRAPRPLGLRAAAAAGPAALALASGLLLVEGVGHAYPIVRDGATATAAARGAPGDVVVTRYWVESQVLAPVLLDGKRIFQTPPKHDLREILERLDATGVHDVLVINKTPVEMTLRSGARVRTVRSYKEKYRFHELVIER